MSAAIFVDRTVRASRRARATAWRRASAHTRARAQEQDTPGVSSLDADLRGRVVAASHSLVPAPLFDVSGRSAPFSRLVTKSRRSHHREPRSAPVPRCPSGRSARP